MRFKDFPLNLSPPLVYYSSEGAACSQAHFHSTQNYKGQVNNGHPHLLRDAIVGRHLVEFGAAADIM